MDWRELPETVNVEYAIDDGYVCIRFRPEVTGKRSSTGKSFLIASTCGGKSIPENRQIRINLSVFAPIR